MNEIQEMQAAEKEINLKIKELRQKWLEKYGVYPDHQMTCFDVVNLLKKAGVLND